ncbi:unnamed protein product [Microthlaspi erraticum]|uniref:Protein NO VEIN C-terminal domain-containing protein n=1 Tax=Microthlaspi erraticum TaxID=1685480 RepID=A0A6D2J8Z5_9BRAS|nr:unnamed protein product [Microthlaspi erraticum]CAA7053349.1 unnamed protein product [Microthlaspi erraticum]
MQGNRGGSWSTGASANGGSGNGNRNAGYLPQPTRVFSNFSVQQPIGYNLQTQHNLNFPHPQILTFLPHQFGAGANVFLQPHGHRGDNSGSRIHGSSSSKSRRNVDVLRIDKTVINTRQSRVASGESVSSTKVSQLVLSQLHAPSWCSYGLQVQDVPSLHQLMTLEGKINAFIHCFIGARRIVTLHDLEVAICRNELVECFDDLELGPLLQHPLVLLYFPSLSGSTSLVQITSEEIISFLDSYLNTYDTDDVKLDEFLSFVAEGKSVTSKEKLGVRIQSLGMYVTFIQDAKRQEGDTLKIFLTELHQKYHMVSSEKQRKDGSVTVSEHADYCGKHTRFDSSSSDDSDRDDFEVENVCSSDRLSSCPYPSVAEEMKRSKKKRKAESCNHEKSKLKRVPSKLHRRDAKQETTKSADDYVAKELVTEALEEHKPIETVAGNENCGGTSSRANKPSPLRPMPMKSGSASGNLVHEWNNSDFSVRDHQFHTGGTHWAAQAQQTGKKGEEIAYRYFAAKYGKEAVVRWVNEQSETGLPYDLVIQNRNGGKKEYVEVKATVSTGKDCFNFTVSEWQFANEKGESYVIAHVLLGNSNAIITQHRNLVRLCQEGHLRLLILMLNQRNQVNVAF